MSSNDGKIQRMNTQYYSRMFSQLKKAAVQPEEKTTTNSRVGSAQKRPRYSKQHMTMNISLLDRLHISTNSIKKPNLSSYISTPLEKSLKKKTLKSQPNTNASVFKMKFCSGKADELRYFTETRQATEAETRQRQLEISLEYRSRTIVMSFREQTPMEELKLVLFRQMLSCNRNYKAELLTLVGYECCDQGPNSFVDYWLSKPTQTLDIFTRNGLYCLTLRPLFSPVTTGEVGLTDYTIYRCVGVGGFSKVYLAKCKLNGRLCALKFISKKYIQQNKKQKLLMNEREILAGTDHPAVITLYHAFETKNFVVFSLEYCPNSELYQFLRGKQRLVEQQTRQIFREILTGIAYLHSKKVVYRDIKLENLLIDAEGHIKITDFGLSKPNCDQNEVTYSYCGSPEYMAPEMLLKCGHSYEVDYYALGILLYELLVGVSPFSAKTKAEIYYSAINSEVKFPKEVPLSKEVKDLLTGLLQKNPDHRIGSLSGIKEIFSHPWVSRKTESHNEFLGKMFQEYREVKEANIGWLEEEFDSESKEYNKEFKNIHYESIKIYKQRINDYLKLEQESKKASVSRSPLAGSSPHRSKGQRRMKTKPDNIFLKKLR